MEDRLKEKTSGSVWTEKEREEKGERRKGKRMEGKQKRVIQEDRSMEGEWRRKERQEIIMKCDLKRLKGE